MKKWLLYIFLFVCFIGFTKLVDYLTRNSDEKFVIRDIKVELYGTISKKIDVRPNLYTHLKIQRYKKSDTVLFAGSFINHIELGDSIIKKKDTPYCFIIHNNLKKKYTYTLIPRKIFHNKDFLPAWKDSCNAGWKPYVVD